MANADKTTDKRSQQRAIRRRRRFSRLTEADEQHILEPVEDNDSVAQPAMLMSGHIPLQTRQGVAQRIGQGQGNGRLQRMLSTVQRKQEQVQRKGKAKISTPVGKDAKKLKSGAAQVVVNGVIVTILPDKRSKEDRLAGKAETNCNINWGKAPDYNFRDDVVTKLKGKPPVPVITIQTTYGLDAKAQDPSAYGRGTTEEDKKAGNTTLGFHEGQHGLDFLQYLKENPLPKFLGAVGMPVSEYEAAKDAYEKATQEYSTQMGEESKAKTDCVGEKASICVVE